MAFGASEDDILGVFVKDKSTCVWKTMVYDEALYPCKRTINEINDTAIPPSDCFKCMFLNKEFNPYGEPRNKCEIGLH